MVTCQLISTNTATKIEIPSERYRDWSVESDSDWLEEEEGVSDFDMLDSDSTPRKAGKSLQYYLLLSLI